MDKILSIIIPTYNMEKYLHNTLSSLLIGKNQELLDVMVINDGSKDSSLSIAKEFEQKYPETFRVIDKENGNYGSCINRGLMEAKGKYIKVLDADDSYDTEAFAVLVDRLLNIDVDLILADYIIVNEQGKQTGKHTRPYLPQNEIIPANVLFKSIGKDIIAMHEIVYRTENLRKISYNQTEGIAFTDVEWGMIPMQTVKESYYIKIPVYKYLVGRPGQTVDVNRAARLQSQGNTTLFVQIDYYSKCTNISEELKKYLLFYILQNLTYTYRTYLISAYKAFPSSSLIEFDNELKEKNLALYLICDNITIHPRIPFHFIRTWRRDKSHIPISIKLYRIILFPIIRKFGLG